MQTHDTIGYRGIYGQSYGLITEYPILYSSLSVQAKSVYAYFCSFTGGGNNTAFPLLTTILKNLNISKDCYYEAFAELKSKGYISVEKKHLDSFKYRNNYVIELSTPEFKKYLTAKGICRPSMMYRYGIVSHAIMIDATLSLKAKALYAYIALKCSGQDWVSIPKFVISKELGLSSRLIGKYTRELVEHHYLSVHQENNERGQFCNTIFSINVFEPDEIKSNDKKSNGTELLNSYQHHDVDNNVDNRPCVDFPEVVNQEPCVDFPDVEKQEVEQNKKYINNNNSIHSIVNHLKENDKSIELSTILDSSTASLSLAYDDVSVLIKKLSFSKECLKPGYEFVYSDIALFNEALSRMLVSKNGYIIKTHLVTQECLKSKLNDYLQMHSIKDLAIASCSRYLASGIEPRNEIAYMSSIIYDMISTCICEASQDENAQFVYEHCFCNTN